jgi:diguanylate cyclase (GGDEF)-like protein
VPDALRPDTPDAVALLADAADALAHGDDVDAALAALLEVASRATGADTAALFLQDPDRVALDPAVRHGLGDDAWARLAEALDGESDPVATAARDRTPIRLTTTDGANGTGGGMLEAIDARRAAIEPLVLTRRGIQQGLGVLVLGWRSDGAARSGEEHLVRAVAGLAAVAVDHARLASLVAERSEWFQRIAQSDPLTGLANERAFGRVLELELARAARQGSQVSLALFDVDGFGEINRAGGHEAGDDVLKAVAAVLNESVRLVDTVARIGGDEFVLLAPGSAGSTVAQRVIDSVRQLPGAVGTAVSVSAGVAHFPADGDSAAAVLDAAAAALAEAKGRGPATLHESTGQPAR